MNKYHISTITEDGKYIGLVTKGEEIVFKTPPQNTPNEASALMTLFIQEGNSQPVRPSSFSAEPSPGVSTQPSPESAPQPPPRKCCGRQ